MSLIGKTLKMQLHHPDIEKKMPKIEGKVLRIVEVKRFKLFGCIVRLSSPFDKKNFMEKDAKEIKVPLEYAILSSEKDNFSELIMSKTLNLGFSLIINKKIVRTNPAFWERNDFIDYSFVKVTDSAIPQFRAQFRGHST